MVQRWGATPQEWADFSLVKGLTKDMLPVVSNPTAPIDSISKMKDLGKTPSRYTRERTVVGYPNWTQVETPQMRIHKWMKEPDYGICIQTRRVRAIDIDVPDKEQAAQIRDFFVAKLGVLPVRYRENSGKCLLAFVMEGPFFKRILRVKEGARDANGKALEPNWNIEFLANGQQFIAAGTHPSGVRYEWDWHGLEDIPSVDIDLFEQVWAQAVLLFGIGDSISAGDKERRRGPDLNMLDKYVDKLFAKGLVIGEGSKGQILIDCPWKDNHSSDTGESQTCYFPAGTNGYEQGHFHCFHASCQGHLDGDFIREMKLDLDVYPVVEAERVEVSEGVYVEAQNLPPLIRNSKGEALPTHDNVCNVIQHAEQKFGFKVAYDSFIDEIVYRANGKEKWEPIKDRDYVAFVRAFDRFPLFKTVSREMVKACIEYCAEINTFDSGMDYLNTLQWDGVQRIGMFCPEYLGTEDTPYTRAVGMYVWSAMAGRIIEPGVKCDMAPILVGAQGVGKTSAVEAMVPHVDNFLRMGFDMLGADLSRLMRGKMVGEISELQGLSTRQLDTIKTFMTHTHENWVPKYKEKGTMFARRLLFIGTSNHAHFLKDTTGNRRWLPMTVRTQCHPELIRRDRGQLLAEGAAMFRKNGVMFRIAEELAKPVHDNYRIISPWQSVIAAWLEQPLFGSNGVLKNRDNPHLTTAAIGQGALQLTPGAIHYREDALIAQAMEGLDWGQKTLILNGVSDRVWRPKAELTVQLDGSTEDD